jgi:beta-mannosidase
VFVSAVPGSAGIVLRAINDGVAALALTVTAVAVAMDGTTRPLQQATTQVGPDAAVTVLTVPNDLLAEGEMLAYVWSDGDARLGGDVFAPKAYKTYDLLPPRLNLSVALSAGSYDLTISAETLALFVAVEADQPGRISHNAVPLFPGHPATLRFTPDAPGVVPNFTLRDLHSATYGSH